MKIIIQTVPHKAQRYDTCGDWQFNDATGELLITVSELRTPHASLLVAVHELVEAMLCHQHGIDEADVDHFDRTWEAHNGYSEPGDDMAAPYYAEHQFACGIERLMAAELGVCWTEYEREIEALVWRHEDDRPYSARDLDVHE